ncbi:MAG TPA: glycine zipper 2TM domain-containing protein [Burkholderiales bacterium]
MKTKTFLSLSLAGLAVSVFAVSMPALAHDGYFYGHGRYGRPHFVYPGERVVIMRPPVFVPRPVFVYRPAPVYYAPAPVYYAAPAPVYYAQPWGTIGGAIAGAAIGSAVGDGRPGAIAAGSVIGAMVGNGLSR